MPATFIEGTSNPRIVFTGLPWTVLMVKCLGEETVEPDSVGLLATLRLDVPMEVPPRAQLSTQEPSPVDPLMRLSRTALAAVLCLFGALVANEEGGLKDNGCVKELI